MFFVCCLALVLLRGAVQVHSATLTVGSSRGWTLGVSYEPLEAASGDTLVFDFPRGQHNVVQLSSPSCDALAGGNELAGLTQTPFTFPVQSSAPLYFACSVPGHCEAGMLLVVNPSEQMVNAPAIAPANSTSSLAPAPSAEGPEAASATSVEEHPGYCEQPVPDSSYPGYPNALTVTCYGPGIAMAPGEVVNYFYTLPNPYPLDEEVAVIRQASQVVDETRRPVPLSENYAHHAFGNNKLLTSEGAELRGTMTEPAIEAPYHLLGNGSSLVREDLRVVNIHLINTLGVLADDLLPCIECWCRDERAVQAGYAGGTACCTSLNCPTPLTHPANHTYYLQYNVTYVPGPVLPQYTIQQYLLDVVNGSVEHDIHAGLPGSTVNVSMTGALDSRCPQAAPFSVVRCTAHQHIGGQCMELLFANGTSICQSCPTYGSSPSVDDIGNEHGYVVKIETDTLATPVQVQPAEEVTLVSAYDASTDHFGVMSLFIAGLADWDWSCPGPPAEVVAFGPRVGEDVGETAGYFEGSGYTAYVS